MFCLKSSRQEGISNFPQASILNLPLESLSFSFCGQRVSSEELLSNNIPTEPYPSKVLGISRRFLVLPYVSSILESFRVLHLECHVLWSGTRWVIAMEEASWSWHVILIGLGWWVCHVPYGWVICFCQEERQILFPLGCSPSVCARMCL